MKIKLSIKARLLGGLAILSILSLVSGIGSITSFTVTKGSVDALYQHRFQAIRLLDRMKTDLLAARDLAVAPKDGAVDQAPEIGRRLRDMEQAWTSYDKLPRIDGDPKANDLFHDEWSRAMSAAAALKPQGTTAEYGAIQAELSKAITSAQRLAAEQEKQVELAYTKTQADYAFSIQCAVSVMLFSLLVAVAVGYSLVSSISSPLRKMIEMMESVAAGDLTRAIDVESTDEIGQIGAALKHMQEGIARLVADVRHTTEVLLPLAEEIAQGSASLAVRNDTQALSLSGTAASMEQLTSTVQQNAENAGMANTLVNNAAEVAVRGGAVVEEVVATMSEIGAASARIVDIIAVIDGISFQTNLLALNAAVEAARAGEQGRGFAVVAGEVRNLAQRSALAAKEVKALIGESAARVADGRRLVGEAGATIGEVVAGVRRVTGMVGDITVASAEQSHGIQRVSKAILSMDDATRQNAALVQETSATAEAMREQARNLSSIVARFKLDAAPPQSGSAKRGAPVERHAVYALSQT